MQLCFYYLKHGIIVSVLFELCVFAGEIFFSFFNRKLVNVNHNLAVPINS